MAEQITLNPIADITQSTSAQNTINANNQTIKTAFLDVLSLTGTSPNQMQSDLDMNSNQIINLSSPATANSPLRLQDAATLNGGGTISSLPAGGTTGQVLAKHSNTNFDVQWQSESTDVAAGSNIAITGTTPITVATVQNPNFTTSVTTPSVITPMVSGSTVTIGNPANAASTVNIGGVAGGGITVNVANSSNGLAAFNVYNSSGGQQVWVPGPGSGTTPGILQFPAASDQLVGRATTDTLTNKTLGATTLSGTVTGGGQTISGLALVSATVLGSTATTGTAPLTVSSTTLVPNLNVATSNAVIGTTTNNNATAGNVGEFVSSTVATGSAVSLTTGTPANVTSIILNAGDWDVSSLAYFNLGATTSVTSLISSISTASATLNNTAGNFASSAFAAMVPTAANPISSDIPPTRLSLATATTIFLVAQSGFTLSTNAAWGTIRARRVR